MSNLANLHWIWCFMEYFLSIFYCLSQLHTVLPLYDILHDGVWGRKQSTTPFPGRKKIHKSVKIWRRSKNFHLASIRGHSRLLKKRPNRQVTKRSLFGLAFFEVTSNRGHCSLFGFMYSRFSYPSLVRVTSIRPHFLTGLIPSIGLRPRAASNRGRSIFRSWIRPLLDPA